MPSRLATLVELLHRVPQAALATHSASMPGYPFASVVAFAPDEQHRPVLLISRLAEHSRNLQQDPRVSLMVAQALGQGEVARATLVGEIVPYPASPAWAERYLRYQPDAQRLLALGDFGFVCLEAVRIQVIGGFARAGWIEGSALREAPNIPPPLEAGLREQLAPGLPEAWTLLGIDAHGADVACAGRRQRISFEPGPVLADAVPAAFSRALQGLLASPLAARAGDA